MWILFNILGTDSHFLPVVPLARALLSRGHEVTFATGEPFCGAVERAGFAALCVGPAIPGSDAVRASKVRSLHGEDRFRFQYSGEGGLLEAGVTHARNILRACRTRKPDVFVRETTAFGAWLAGERLNVPVATFDFDPRSSRERRRLIGAGLHLARAQMGLCADQRLATLDSWLTLLGAPPGWYDADLFRATTHLFQPPEDEIHSDSRDEWFPAKATRPNVYVTLGTTGNRTPGVFPMVLEAVEALDANIVVTVGATIDPRALGAVPSHVRVERFIPQAEVLARCDAVICHAGYGSLMGALRKGVPVVTIPLQAADNAANARRIERLGVGIAVMEDERSVARIRAAAASVVALPQYRNAARSVAESMLSLRPFADGAELVERLARERSPVLA